MMCEGSKLQVERLGNQKTNKSPKKKREREIEKKEREPSAFKHQKEKLTKRLTTVPNIK